MNNIPSESITDIYNYISDKNIKIYDTKLDQFDIINQYLEKKFTPCSSLLCYKMQSLSNYY